MPGRAFLKALESLTRSLLLALAPCGVGLAGDDPSFLTGEQVVWLDRSQVIPVRVTHVQEHDVVFDTRVAGPEHLEILRPAEVLAGESLGYMRVRGLRAGNTQLLVGGATLHVEVARAPASARLRELGARILGPTPGTVAWGEIQVGVEVTGSTDAGDHEVLLRLPGGERISGSTSVATGRSAFLHTVFAVDVSAFPAGPIELVAEVRRVRPAASPALADEGVVSSEPITITVAHPAERDLTLFECESSGTFVNTRDYGPRSLPVGADADASGGQFLVQRGALPVWTVSFPVATPGRYQVVARVRGDYGAGAFPTIALSVDGETGFSRTARVVDRRWQRIPVGPPLNFEAGERSLGVRFANDLSVAPTSDRDLYLDRIELLRLDGAEGQAVEAGMSLSPAPAAPPSLTGGNGLWVAFARAFDGLPVNGRLEIIGYCRWTGMGSIPAPSVDLVLNDAVVSSQQAARPVFALDRAAFSEGANTLQLVARLEDGREARSALQTVLVNGSSGSAPARPLHRFSVHDARWAGAFDGTFTDRGQEPGQTVALPPTGSEVTLALPAELEGEFELFCEARSQVETAVKLALLTHEGVPAGGEPAEGASNDDPPGLSGTFRGWWSYHTLGRLTLLPGPKQLRLTFSFDAQVPADVNQALNLRALLLREVRAPDRFAPRVAIAYPGPGHVAHGVDAVVLDAYDDSRLAEADLVIDGQPQTTFGHVPDGAGYVVLPLLLRGLPPGEHTLAARVTDADGNLGMSPEITFTVAAQPPPNGTPYARAVRLLNRFAYGPEPEQLAALLLEGEVTWLRDRLTAPGAGDAVSVEHAEAQRGDAVNGNYARWVTSQMLRTSNPVRARLCAWIENHFSTYAGKTGQATEWGEHLRILELGPAPFLEVLLASTTSPAMLAYLDQATSYAGRMNENYAREVMELHTVGVDGGYDQEDVQALAGLLCGLTLSLEATPSGEGPYLSRQFRFDPELGDGLQRDVLGMRFRPAASDQRLDRLLLALEMLAAHPSTARFLCTKLAEHYVSTPPPPGLVEDLVPIFQSSGGDLAAVAQAIGTHDAFQHAGSPRFAHPVDFALRLGRTTGALAGDYALADYIRRSGMGFFDRATPDGYPEEDSAWVDTNALMQRWRLAQNSSWIVRGLVPNRLRRGVPGDPSGWRQRVVDHAAVRLTGMPLSDDSNKAALEFLAQAEGNSWTQVDQVLVLMCRLPEASLK